jgi:hypothetical protein
MNHGYSLFWPANSGGRAKGISATSDNNIYFTASTADDNSAAPTYPFKFDMSTGELTATGDIIAFSDQRIKDNIQLIDNSLDKVLQLRGVTFTRKDQDDGKKHTGVIAQDVLKVLPEAVSGSEDTTYSVAYGNLVGLLIEAIKELNAKIERLEDKDNK